ncbi:MAG: DUF72 domain-containing protein [Candidatus Omnitrophica bacterium]|nr:DUF72 domain-containing protein [Candidatus Omnitrophota bacterium]MCM8799229.1 DUF72 domain-containing protein [Candidatus Omnitrophota bacterium]
MPNIFVGTSGWVYQHWRNVFYPEDLSQNRWFEYYTQFFNSVELNVTFYRLPKKETFKGWFRRSPKNFYFVAKGSRFITHIKRLDDEATLKNFFNACLELKEKLAAVLWQLPSYQRKDLVRLENFLKALKKYKIRNVFEFRDRSWFVKETYDILKDYNVCLCIADSIFWPQEKVLTADFLYLRFHGRDGLYSGNYSDKELKYWANFALSFKKDIFAFFNNDAFGFAVKNALRFKEFLKE